MFSDCLLFKIQEKRTKRFFGQERFFIHPEPDHTESQCDCFVVNNLTQSFASAEVDFRFGALGILRA